MGVQRQDGGPATGWESRDGMGVQRQDGGPETGWGSRGYHNRGCFEDFCHRELLKSIKNCVLPSQDCVQKLSPQFSPLHKRTE